MKKKKDHVVKCVDTQGVRVFVSDGWSSEQVVVAGLFQDAPCGGVCALWAPSRQGASGVRPRMQSRVTGPVLCSPAPSPSFGRLGWLVTSTAGKGT